MADSNENGAGFEALITPHMDRLYRLAFRLAGDVAEAEDLVQDVLVKSYERRDELTSIEALGPWLSRVLYNRFIDNARRYTRSRLKAVSLDQDGHGRRVNESLQSNEPGPEDNVALAFDINALSAALGELSLEHRAVLLMHDSEGYKLEEIQTITGVPLGTLKSRLHRARARLRELLRADGTFGGRASL